MLALGFGVGVSGLFGDSKVLGVRGCGLRLGGHRGHAHVPSLTL